MLALALRRYWFLVLVVVVLCTGAGLALGNRQATTYQAAVVMQVGRLDIQAQAVPGYVSASQSLASAYSRIASAQVIAAAVARRLRLPIARVRKDLSATSVPESPTLRILGDGRSARAAVTLSRAGAAELGRYVQRLTSRSDQSAGLLGRFRRLTTSAERLRAQAKAAAGADKLNGLRQESPRTVSTRVAAAAAQLRADSAAELFKSAQTNAVGGASLSTLDSGAQATNDRRQLLQRFGFVGLVGGLVLGTGFALLLAGRRRSRRS